MLMSLTVKVFVERKTNRIARGLIVKKQEVYLEPKIRMQKIMELLEKEHSDAKIALRYRNCW